jgi:hypothetical protein
MNTSAKVFLACAFGAFVGSLIALQLGIKFWWLGMLAGGLCGYLTYEIQEVFSTIRTAWNATISWRPNKEWWGGAICYAFFMSVFLMTIMAPIGLLAALNIVLTSKMGWIETVEIASVSLILFWLFVFSVCVAGYCDADESLVNTAIRCGKKYNPFSFYFWVLPRFIGKIIYFLVTFIPDLGTAMAKGFCLLFKFVKTTLRLIHSDLRLLCGTDAAIGAAIGYFCGNAIIGALAGGVFGVLNYEIVSKYIFKLVPASK